jgi:tetratricopeptide (TPR) repeat protein
MPRLKDVDRFRQDLAKLSREPEILERWGEKQEYPPLPEGPDKEPSRPAPRSGPKPAPGQAARTAPQAKSIPKVAKPEPEEGLPPDFETLLAQLPLEAEAAEAEAKEAPSLGGTTASGGAEIEELEELGDFDLESLVEPEGGVTGVAGVADEGVPGGFEEGPAPGPGLVDTRARGRPLAGLEESAEEIPVADFLSDLGEAAEEPEALEEEAAPPAEAEEAAPESFSLDEFSIPDFGGEAANEAAPEAPAAFEPEATEMGAAEPPAGESFSMDEFSIPDFGGEEAGSPAAGGEAAPSADEFTLPDLGDFGGEAGAAPDAGALDLGSAEDLGSFEAPSPSVTAEAAGPAAAPPDDFSIPEMGDFSLEEETSGGGTATGSAQAGPAESTGIEEGFSFDESAFGSGSGTDAFDSFSLDGKAGAGSLGSEDLDSQLAALGEEISPASTFNLDKDWGAGFEMPGVAPEKPSAQRRAAAAERPRPEPEEKARPVSLAEDQVDRLQDRLLSFPLNLRLAVEDSIANGKGSEAQRSKLVWALVERKPFEEVAALVSKILKRRITLPEGYEKSTGAAFEAEKGSFHYAFVHTILPILRTGLLVLVAAGIFGYLGYRFVYRPLAANALYRSGYARIAEDRYAEAEDAFARATEMREFVPWYYRYAQAYVAKRQYLLAEKKYSDLLSRHPAEAKGALEWAALERLQLKYAEGVKVLQDHLLGRDYLNKEGLLLEGDIYLDWADEVPAHYEDARRSYATLIQAYGMEDLYLERMLLYFMRTDNLKEVLPLKTHFLSAEKPFPSASTLAELGGYLFDKGIMEEVHTILLDAEAKDRLLPEVHYQLARYFHRAAIPAEERKALDNAVKTFGLEPILSRRREAMFIDSYLMRANFELEAREYVAAEADYSAAAAEYERAQALGRLARSARFAAAYAGMGEVAYWQRDDLAAALSYFERAAAEGWDSPSLRYERGYILYRQGRPREATEQFYMAGRDGKESPYLLFAFGNALYARQDWHAAEGYFLRTVEAMNRELEQISLPVPSERASHAEIAELLMEAENNLGAALYKASARAGDARKRALAVSAFTESTRLYDSLTRDQAAMPRAGGENLGLANLNLLMGARGVEPRLFLSLEKGMDFPKR